MPSRVRTDDVEGVVRAVFVGMMVMLAGTLPRNALFAANLKFANRVPWAVPVMAVFLVFFWRYLDGAGPPAATSAARRAGLRGNALTLRTWAWALATGVLGIVTLVLALRVVNRLVLLPEQRLPDLAGVPRITVLALLLAGAPVAGIVEEAAFRGYMQGPIERRWGLPVAILITGTLFAIAHLDFTPILWPYYLAVATLYGVIAQRTNSILPTVALHTMGNLYSNLDLWRTGHAEWQAQAGAATLIRTTGVDRSFELSVLAMLAGLALTVLAFLALGRATTSRSG